MALFSAEKGAAALAHLLSLWEGKEGACRHLSIMNKHDAASTSRGPVEEEPMHLSPPGLLEENQTLILNPGTRTLSLLYIEADDGAHMITEQQFSRNGMSVLLQLLQHYPGYCPYEVLLASLYPISPLDGRKQLQKNWTTAIRPVRRAIGTIKESLRLFGLQIYAIRGTGYVLRKLEDRPDGE
jgi:hypothetical protein